MKLSMWMLANRLQSFGPELHIGAGAAASLKSARHSYAPDCVYVTQQNEDVICRDGADYFILKNMSVHEAGELLQSVFDFYTDWEELIRAAAESGDYQRVVDISWILFHNPMVIIDSSYRALAMSGNYPPEDMDKEWQHLKKYRFASISSIQKMHNPQNVHLYVKSGAQHYKAGLKDQYSGIVCRIVRGDAFYAQINVLEKEHDLNQGDLQNLEALAAILRPFLTRHVINEENIFLNTGFIQEILGKQHIDKESVRLQLASQNWEISDTYQMYLIHFRQTGSAHAPDIRMILYRTIFTQLESCILLPHGSELLCLRNLTKESPFPGLFSLERFAKDNDIIVCESNPVPSIFYIRYLPDQLRYILNIGNYMDDKKNFHSFYPYAISYIMQTDSLNKSLCACHLNILKLWLQKLETEDPEFETLDAYLYNSGSLVATAASLHIHRNTLVYRLKKIKENFHADLDDQDDKDYMRMSIWLLKILEMRWTWLYHSRISASDFNDLPETLFSMKS